jgi:hypothetical protein
MTLGQEPTNSGWPAPAPAPAAPPAPPPVLGKRWYQRKLFWAATIVAIIVISVVASDAKHKANGTKGTFDTEGLITMQSAEVGQYPLFLDNLASAANAGSVGDSGACTAAQAAVSGMTEHAGSWPRSVKDPWVQAQAELQTGVDACIENNGSAMVAAWNLGSTDLNAAVAAYKALDDCRPNSDLGLDCG